MLGTLTAIIWWQPRRVTKILSNQLVIRFKCTHMFRKITQRYSKLKSYLWHAHILSRVLQKCRSMAISKEVQSTFSLVHAVIFNSMSDSTYVCGDRVIIYAWRTHTHTNGVINRTKIEQITVSMLLNFSHYRLSISHARLVQMDSFSREIDT